MIPELSAIRQDDTHRLIPSAPNDESVLARLADNESDLEDVIELDGATNDRLLGEANQLPGISVHELLFGVAHAGIVNAAFTHAHPAGSRFNGPERGAWYCAFELKTAQAEVAFHKSEELGEINWNKPEEFSFADYLGDFRGGFHDLRGKAAYGRYLSPDDYSDSQQLAADLLAAGSAGIVYPSIRQNRGTCLVCFRPALVTNVRQGLNWTLAVRSKEHKSGRLSWSASERPH